jgi:hypothetical protein
MAASFASSSFAQCDGALWVTWKLKDDPLSQLADGSLTRLTSSRECSPPASPSIEAAATQQKHDNDFPPIFGSWRERGLIVLRKSQLGEFRSLMGQGRGGAQKPRREAARGRGLARKRPKGGRRSLRAVSAELAARDWRAAFETIKKAKLGLEDGRQDATTDPA